MPSLIASAPLSPAPVSHGAATLTVLDLASIFWIAPYPGHQSALATALDRAHGVGWPAVGGSIKGQGAEIRWAGRDQAMLLADRAPDLAEMAAVTDVSDVYARMHVGPTDAAADVLARLVPLDLRRHRFAVGQVARSLLGHVPAQFCATDDGIEVMVMRSFAQTAHHEIERAMESVAGRAALSR